MKEKKGVSPLIAWVLLIGLSVSIGFLIINWAVQNIPEPEPELSFCDDVNLFLVSSESEPGKVTLEIVNNGLFTVDKFTFGVIEPEDYENAQCLTNQGSSVGGSPSILEIGFRKEYSNPNCPSSGSSDEEIAEEIYLIPWIRISEDEDAINCNDKKLIIDFNT